MVRGPSFQRKQGVSNFQRQEGWQKKTVFLLSLRRASIIFRVVTAAVPKLDRSNEPRLEPQCRYWINWADTQLPSGDLCPLIDFYCPLPQLELGHGVEGRGVGRNQDVGEVRQGRQDLNSNPHHRKTHTSPHCFSAILN